MKKLLILPLLFILSFINQAEAQKKEPTLELATFLKAKTKVKDPIINVYDESGKKLTVNSATTAGGRVLLYFPFNQKYKVVVEREGFVTINFTVNANLPEGEKAENMSSDLDLKMIEQPLDGSKEVFDKPVAKVDYIKKIGMFDFDWDYDDEISDELADLEKKIRDKDKKYEKELKDKDSEIAKAEFEKQKAEEEARKAEAEAEKEAAIKAAEEEAKKAEAAKAAAKLEEERLKEEQRKAEEARKEKEEELKRLAAEEEKARKEAEEAQRKAEEERKKREEEEKKLEEERRKAEEAAKKAEEERLK